MILIIIPTYNEAENIKELVETVLSLDENYAVLVVDDNSPDGTGKIADRLAANHPQRVFVLHRSQKQGLGPAYRDAFNWALGSKHLTSDVRYFVTMDADWSHDPKGIPRLVTTAKACPAKPEGRSGVIGSRYVTGGKIAGWAWHRRVLSRLGNLYARFLTRVPILDLTSGFQCFPRVVLEKIDFNTIQSNGYAFLIELKFRAHQAGFKLTEIPITFRERRAGQPKMNLKIALEALYRIPLLRFKG